MSSLKVGLIGCGRIVQLVHLNVLARLPDVELVALAEPDPQRREEASRRVPKAIAFSGYQEMLEKSDVDAAVICLPNALHAEAAEAALKLGKHVYLEKPLAANLEDARDALEAWRSAGTVGMMGFNYRFNPIYQAAKEYIKSGQLGELVSVRSVFSSAARTLPAWQQLRSSGGGVLLNLASHHIDMVRFLFEQEVSQVWAQVRTLRSEGDSAMLELQLTDGLPVQSFFSMSAVDEDRFEIYGQAGKLTLDRYQVPNLEIAPASCDFSRLKPLGRKLKSLLSSPNLVRKILAPSNELSYQAALAHFVAAARSNQPTKPDFWDGYCSLAVIEAAEESARTGKSVSLKVDENFAC